MNRARHGRCAQSGRAEIIRRSQDGAANTTASGEVYNLHSISDFKGLYTQSSGGPGLVESGASDLWLRNAAEILTGCGAGPLYGKSGLREIQG
jgi:hypothetical protein